MAQLISSGMNLFKLCVMAKTDGDSQHMIESS